VRGENDAAPLRQSYLTTVDDPTLPIMERHMKVLIYICPQCRYAAMFAPPSPLEEFEKRQAEEQAITDPVEKFMYNFRDYSDEKLQRVVDGRDYTPEAKKPPTACCTARRRTHRNSEQKRKHPVGCFLFCFAL
jgi:hypothetical protein